MSTEAKSERSRSEEGAVPYRDEQPYGKLDELVNPGVLDLGFDERLWVPQAEDVGFRPLLLTMSQG